ncbi:MAG: HD domain-containing protein [Anaerolineales bacterium]|nr:HD domain-containing protein [Anaerolineales bacterium]MCB8991671.1 HD domain-containing protein [Ardenticatenaceae bacterium]MCB9005565.1 HD domain-containing protein [Ardenticatenaceae bacterium]
MKAKEKKKKKNWRKAAQQAMLKATEQELVNRHGKIDPSFNYRWEHVTAVVTLAIKLAHLTGADPDIVEAAAWLHDIRKDTKDNHSVEGAKFARKFLPRTNFPEKKIESVARAIEEHMGLWRDKPLKMLESQVLWDADKLAKIGLTAVFHWTGGSLAGDKMQTIQDLIKRSRNVDWQAKTVASMHTEPARHAAQARLQAYTWLWNQLENELQGNDLEEAVSD